MKSQRKVSDPKPAHAINRSDIPSTLDPTLFSTISSKRASGSRLVKIPESISADIIEISDSDDVVPLRSSDKGKAKLSPSAVRKSSDNGATLSKQNSNTLKEVIEIFDSDEESPSKTLSTRTQPMSEDLEPISPTTTTARTSDSCSRTIHLANDDDSRQEIDFVLKGKSSIQRASSATADKGRDEARLPNTNEVGPSSPVTRLPPSERHVKSKRETADITGHDHEQQQAPTVPSSPPSFSPPKKPLNRQGFNLMSVPSAKPKSDLYTSKESSSNLDLTNKASSAHSILCKGIDSGSKDPEVFRRRSLISDDDESPINMPDLNSTPSSQSPKKERMGAGSVLQTPNDLQQSTQEHSQIPVAFSLCLCVFLMPDVYFSLPQKWKASARKLTGDTRRITRRNTSDNVKVYRDHQTAGDSLESAIDLTTDISDKRIGETKISNETVSPISPKISASISMSISSMLFIVLIAHRRSDCTISIPRK